MSDRTPLPEDPEAERLVIGALMFSRDAADVVLPILRPDDFYDAKHEAIYAAIEEVVQSGQIADAGTVAHRLTLNGKMARLAAVDGPAYLCQLVGEVGTVAGVAQHAGIIKEMALLRRLVLLGDDIRHKGISRLHQAGDLLGFAQREIGALADVAVANKPVKMKRGLFEVFDQIKALENRQQFVTGVPSGLDDLDDMTAGYQPGDLIVIAGRPSMGKTAMVIGNIMAAGKAGIPGLLFSLEMKRASIFRRVLSWECSIDGMLLRSGVIAGQTGKLERGVMRILNYPTLVDDSAMQTLMTIQTVARKWRRDPEFFPPGQELGLLCVDYLQLVTPMESKAQISREREIAIIAQGLKALARELHIPVVALAQINRGTESRSDRRPGLGDLRESGALEQIGDLILGLYRDEYYNKQSEDKGIAEILVMKQREGSVGTVKVAYLPQYTRFANLKGDPWTPSTKS